MSEGQVEEPAMIPLGSRTCRVFGSLTQRGRKVGKDMELFHSLLLVFPLGLYIIQMTSPYTLLDSSIK